MKPYLFAVIGLLASSAAMPDDLFRDRACPVQFVVPSGWEYEVNPKAPVFMGEKRPRLVCTVGLRPPQWGKKRAASALQLPAFPLTIAVIRRPFLEVAREAGFKRVRETYEGSQSPSLILRDLKPDDWTVTIRQGDAPARQYRTACCQGVRGDTWGNTEAKDGSKATFSNELAVLNDQHGHSAVIETDSADEFRIVTNLVVRSFEFKRGAAN